MDVRCDLWCRFISLSQRKIQHQSSWDVQLKCLSFIYHLSDRLRRSNANFTHNSWLIADCDLRWQSIHYECVSLRLRVQ